MGLSVVHVSVPFLNAAGQVIYNAGAFGPDPIDFDITYTNHQSSGGQAVVRVGAAKGAPVGTNVNGFDAEHLQWMVSLSVNGGTSQSAQFSSFADWGIDSAWQFIIYMTTANLGTGYFDIGAKGGVFPIGGGSTPTTDMAAILKAVTKAY